MSCCFGYFYDLWTVRSYFTVHFSHQICAYFYNFFFFCFVWLLFGVFWNQKQCIGGRACFEQMSQAGLWLFYKCTCVYMYLSVLHVLHSLNYLFLWPAGITAIRIVLEKWLFLSHACWEDVLTLSIKPAHLSPPLFWSVRDGLTHNSTMINAGPVEVSTIDCWHAAWSIKLNTWTITHIILP